MTLALHKESKWVQVQTSINGLGDVIRPKRSRSRRHVDARNVLLIVPTRENGRVQESSLLDLGLIDHFCIPNVAGLQMQDYQPP